jgi:glycosyltransferase involved in cell wall biosynthesis
VTSFLFLSTMNGAAWGGSEPLWASAAALLAREGHQVICAAFDWPGKRERLRPIESAGGRVHLLPNWGRPKRTPVERIAHEALARPAVRLALRALPIGRVDHVVLSQGTWDDAVSGPYRSACRRARGYTLVSHNYSEEAPPRRPRMLAGLVAGARANLFAADRARAVLSLALGIEVPRAAVVFNPLSFDPPEQPPPLPRTGPVRFAVMAALDLSRKAQDVLVEALAAPGWAPRDWRLDLYGGGPDRERLAALVRARGLEQRVTLRGHVSDVAGALSTAHVLVQATHRDAMPIAVHEAMALGRPCLVSRIGDMPDWITEGRTGWVCDRVDLAELGRGLERAWAARERWSEMGKLARQEFGTRFPRDPASAFAERLLQAARS